MAALLDELSGVCAGKDLGRLARELRPGSRSTRDVMPYLDGYARVTCLSKTRPLQHDALTAGPAAP